MHKKKTIKSIVEWFIYILIFIILVWGTPKALVKLLKTDYPIAAVTSSSMWPTLKRGDIIFVKGINPKTIQINDIVVWRGPSKKMLSGRRINSIHCFPMFFVPSEIKRSC